MKLLLRTDGNLKIGNGHVVRVLALANKLKEQNINYLLAIKSDDFWFKKISKNHNVKKISNDFKDILDLIDNESITHFIYDTRNDLIQKDFDIIKQKYPGLKLIVIDNPEEIRNSADLYLSPPIPQINLWSWPDFKGLIKSDWEYVFLRSDFKKYKKNKDSNFITLSFGSTDPFYLTEKVLRQISINKDVFKDYKFRLIVGPQFKRLDEIKKTSYFKNLNIETLQSPKNIAKVFSDSFFSIIAFGVTAYEFASLGIPFLSISISKDHELSSKVFSDNGLSKSLGTLDIFEKKFKKNIETFFNDYKFFKTKHENFENKICDWNLIINSIIN